MGMDVYGKAPANEVGAYFRRNVWGWHPLWGYVEDQHPEIAELVQHAHTNDGDGLTSAKSLKLARLLQEDLANGVVDEYISARQMALSLLPRETCNLCSGTGIRTDAIAIEHKMPEKELSPELQILLGRTHGTCNACNSEGSREAFELSYRLDREDIEQFADFLENCGGFEIC